MKKRVLSILLLNVLTLILLTGCGSKYCTIAGCPQEAYAGSNYCVYHKCANSNCKNARAGSYSYCESCIKRSLNK